MSLFSVKTSIACALMISAVAVPARAAVIDWTAWSPSSVVTGSSGGSVSGTAGPVGVSYSGEVESLQLNYPSWTPASSYVGGSVGNAPLPSDNIIQLYGGNSSVTDTVTFSEAVTNPVVAIWSLGEPGIEASFQFTASEPFAIQAGGPSAEYGGSSITALGSGVYGVEGNGTIQFIGTFNSISWNNPTYEDWYGVTVGVSPVPEPATWAMILVGLAGLGFLGYRKAKSGTAAFAAA
jgi:PEP-CTERM motif